MNRVPILLIFICANIFAQTGPGGVGTNNGTSDLVMWYRTDNGVTNSGTNVSGWTNSAGYAAHDMSQNGNAPQLITGSLNGYDEIQFNTTGILRTGLNLTTSNFVTNQASSFIYAKANSITSSWPYSTLPHQSQRFSCHIPWSNSQVYFDIGQCCNQNARIQVGGLSNLTSYSLWTYDANPSTGKQLYRNGTLLQNRANTRVYSSHASHRFGLGDNFNGNMTEVIIFRTKINTAQRIIIDNYLTAKYNQSLASIDFYDEDTSGGNFDHKVAGIGQASDGSNHTNSQGTGIISISSPSNLSNNEYLFWGEDLINANYDFSAVAAPSKRYRLDTKWRVSETGDVGTVNFSVNASNIDLTGAPTGILKLVRSTVSDFSTVSEEYDLTLSGGVYSATISFNDNDYFTLEVVPTSDLSLRKTVNNAIPKVGEGIIFTLTVSNAGPQEATNVVVRDLLPLSLSYDAGNSVIGVGTYNAVSGDWSIPSIPSGASRSIQIAATIDSAGIITNTLEVISLDQEDPDATPNNQQ